MTTSKRAWLYVRRNRKRTILLFLLFAVLMTISLLGFALHAASSAAVRELRGSIGGYFTIQTGASGAEKTDEALLQQVKTLDNVRTYNGVDTYYMYTEGLSLLPASWHGTGQVGEFMPKFIGCTDSSLHERFVSVSFQLAEGRHIGPDDQGKAVISKDVAALNGLAVGDTISASVVQGVRDWPEDACGTQAEFEIVGVYSATQSEPAGPATPECDLQENIIFTDIASAKRLAGIKFPNRSAEEYVYSSGLMLFLADPAKMDETVSMLRQQPAADWDSFVISQNSAAYQQAAAPIQKAETISSFLLLVILVISIGILSLTLLMWTRERMTEIGVFISLGISGRGIWGQLLLENYIVAAPAFAAALLLSMALVGPIGGAVGLLEGVRIGAAPAAAVLVCAALVILITAFLASLSILRKKPKEILIDLS